MSAIEKIKLRSFRFLTEDEVDRAKALAKIRGEDPEKVRITGDVEVWVRVTELSNKHRVLEFTSEHPQFVLHSRDLATILRSQDFEMIDLRVSQKD